MKQNLKSYPVWDRPTRWFHWINFVCVVALAAIGTAILFDSELGVTDEGKILLKTTHVWFGYVFAANLAWRVAWAFIGNRHAGWSAILPFRTGYGAALKTYLSGLIGGDVRPYLGHNPVARAMVSIFFFLLILRAITGLVLAGTDIYYPPFGRWIAGWIAAPGIDPSTIVPYDKTGIDPNSWEAMRSLRSAFLTVHYWNFYALLFASSSISREWSEPNCAKVAASSLPCLQGGRYSMWNQRTMSEQVPDRTHDHEAPALPHAARVFSV